MIPTVDEAMRMGLTPANLRDLADWHAIHAQFAEKERDISGAARHDHIDFALQMRVRDLSTALSRAA